jgi:hypothetical protein
LKNNSKILKLRTNKENIGNTKYSPSFSKEWTNTIYSFDKNKLRNLPIDTLNINKIIKSYFNLFFKYEKAINTNKFILRKRRRNFLRRIFLSNIEIKHNNNKVIITVYTFNKEKNLLKEKYMKINNIINKKLIQRFFVLYKRNINQIYNTLTSYKYGLLFVPNMVRKSSYIKYKFKNLNKFILLKHLYLKKVWTILIKRYANLHKKNLMKYSFLYSLNQLKFNKLTFLSKLSSILYKILSKKIEYNIINLKYVTYSPDIFTHLVTLKLKRRKGIKRLKIMLGILNRTKLPFTNTITERTFSKENKNWSVFFNKYRDLKVLSNIKNTNLNDLLNKTHSLTDRISKDNSEEISNSIYHSIKYKNIGGVRLEVKGRLSKRYRADRSIYSVRWKGGLKNIDSSFKRINTTLYRGNVKPNLLYSLSASKRRIGAFAVKCWLSGK